MKQMWDKKVLVEVIHKESPKVEIDSELSETSENPVQNKVIYEALGDKQDSLPDTTGQTDKFLKVGSEGLEWASVGGSGSTKYLHYVTIVDPNATFSFVAITNFATPFTRPNESNSLAQWLYDNGFSSISKRVYGSGNLFMIYSNGDILIGSISAISSSDGTTIRGQKANAYHLSGTVTDSKVVYSGSSDTSAYVFSLLGSTDTIRDAVIEL